MAQRSEADRPPEGGRRLTLTWSGRTAMGLVRTNNEDTLWGHSVGAPLAKGGNADGRLESLFPGALFAVADGMGGALAGEVASGLAVSILGSEMAQRSQLARAAGDDLEGWLTRTLVAAVESANVAIRQEGDSNPQRRGMGTTLTCVWLVGDTAVVGQVGDSRAYLFRGGHLKQITKDQSLVGKLIEDGIITEEEADKIAGKNIILQALGSEEPLEVVAERHRLQPGDALLLCTDGLSGVVTHKEIEEELRRGGPALEVCQRLIALAEKRGGPDNITVLLVRADVLGRRGPAARPPAARRASTRAVAVFLQVGPWARPYSPGSRHGRSAGVPSGARSGPSRRGGGGSPPPPANQPGAERV